MAAFAATAATLTAAAARCYTSAFLNAFHDVCGCVYLAQISACDLHLLLGLCAFCNYSGKCSEIILISTYSDGQTHDIMT